MKQSLFSKPEELFQVTSPYYCAGFTCADEVITNAAPIIHWTVGKELTEVLSYFKRKGFSVERIET